MKEAPKKAYWQTREAFRNSVSTLRKDSVDAESLFSADSMASLETIPASPQYSAMVSPDVSPARGREEARKGSLNSLRRKWSVKSGVR